MARRKSMTFFAPNRERAEKHVKKIKHDHWIDTGKHMQGHLRLSDEQMKHSSRWKTWKW